MLVRKFGTTMKNVVRDVAKGPLDVYRKKSSFDWKSLKLHLEGEDCIRYQVNFFFFLDPYIILSKV